MSASEHRTESDLTHQAADWHARLRGGSLSEVEEARFRAWLSGDPARRREFDEISALWDKLESVANSPEVLGELRVARAPAPAPARRSRRAFVGWALASAAGVAAAVGFVSWQRMLAPEIYETGVGEQRPVPLSDGSVITLNTSSRVEARISDGQRRIAILQGQANFEVAKDPARPFIVSAGKGEVLALGTTFDVYRRSGDVVVTLIEGRVAVVPEVPAGQSGASVKLVSSSGVPDEAAQAALRAIVLAAGEQVTFGARDRAPVRGQADLQRVSAWRARKLDFADTTLAEAIAEGNRYSNLKLELRAPEFADSRLSGVFDAGRNDALAEGLAAYFGLRAERTGDDLIVLTRKTR
jgi:transmembrane sensor